MKTPFAFLLLMPLVSLASEVTSFQGKVKIDPRVNIEIKKFEINGQKLPDSYVSSFSQQMLRKVFQDKRNFISSIQEGKACSPNAQVNFLRSGELLGPANLPRVEQDVVNDFENGIIRIESVGCLGPNKGLAGMNKFNNTAFKLSTISELKSSKSVHGLICEQTSVTGLGNSDYCYTSANINTDAENFLFTQNVTNAPIALASAPVYYRSTYTSFHELGNDTFTHTIAYVRGPKIPGILRGIARSKILAAQKKGNQKLAEGL
jgi:hypothetical protein